MLQWNDVSDLKNLKQFIISGYEFHEICHTEQVFSSLKYFVSFLQSPQSYHHSNEEWK